MGKEWSLDRIIKEGREGDLRAYARSAEDQMQVNAWLERLEQQQEKADHAAAEDAEEERERAQKIYQQFVDLYYGKLPAEQYNVLFMRIVWNMSRQQIAERTGKSRAALRKNLHDARENIKRMNLAAAPR